jgi:hypothetical protein
LLGCRNRHRAILKSVRMAGFGQPGNARLFGANLISGVWGRETGNE